MKPKKNMVFISYRRDGGAELARLVSEILPRRGYRVFMDVESLRSGPFNTALLSEIESASEVVVILTPGSLDRCRNAGRESFPRQRACFGRDVSRSHLAIAARS
jgi:hypothetical protein